MNISRHIRIISSGLLIVVIAAGATVGILKLTMSASAHKVDHAAVATVQPVLSASGTIEAYQKSTIPRLFSSNYAVQDSTMDATPYSFAYTVPKHSYTLGVSSNDYVTYTEKVGSGDSLYGTFSQQVNQLLIAHGFTAGSDKHDGGVSSRNFQSGSVVCQVSGQSAEYMIACIDMTAIDQQNTTAKTLLNLYASTDKAALSPATYTSVNFNNQTSGNKEATMLLLGTTNQPLQVLLFAAVNNSWAYLGNITSNTPAHKIIVSPAVMTAAGDPKYGDFLTTLLREDE